MDRQKILYWVGFAILAVISVWATTSSFMLIMPNWVADNTVITTMIVFAFVLVLFVISSLALKWVIESYTQAYVISDSKMKSMRYGGLLLFITTWMLVSLPTNAHTFFYKLMVGNVVKEDLTHTIKYTRQLSDRVVVDSVYNDSILTPVMAEWDAFCEEVQNGSPESDFQKGIGKYASRHIGNINAIIKEPDYHVPVLPHLKGYSNAQCVAVLNEYRENILTPTLNRLKSDKYQVSIDIADEATGCLVQLETMQDTIVYCNQIGALSKASSNNLVKQCEGVLNNAYTNIKTGFKYVVFDNKTDEALYTAENLDTRTSRFLNPYSVMGDFFAGDIPLTFLFWILLSIIIDVSGFILFYLANK